MSVVQVADELLDLAVEAMRRNIRQLEYLKREWIGKRGLGIERWFEVELCAEIYLSGKLDFKKRGKGPDLEVQNFLVELKCPTDYNYPGWVLEGFKSQPKPHIVLFLAPTNNDFLNRLAKKAKNYKLKYKPVNSDWIVGYLVQ